MNVLTIREQIKQIISTNAILLIETFSGFPLNHDIRLIPLYDCMPGESTYVPYYINIYIDDVIISKFSTTSVSNRSMALGPTCLEYS